MTTPINGAGEQPQRVVITVGAWPSQSVVLQRNPGGPPLGCIQVGGQPIGWFLTHEQAAQFAAGPEMTKLVALFVDLLSMQPADEKAATDIGNRLGMVMNNARATLESSMAAMANAQAAQDKKLIIPASAMPLGKLIKG